MQNRGMVIFRLLLLFVVFVLLLTGSNVPVGDPFEAMRRFSRNVEFDFAEWTLDALFQEAVTASLKAERFFSDEQQHAVVSAYLDQVSSVTALNAQLDETVSAPSIINRDESIKAIEEILDKEQNNLDQLAPLAEAVVQSQTEMTLVDLGFGLGGQVFPPVLYKVSELPLSLIVSPRTEIKTVLDISLAAGLDSLEKNAIEEGIYQEYDYSALVEPIGGLSAYPTMVMQTTDLNWLTETVAHEWIHNYLVFRPLGVRYEASAEMRTINETVASLAGSEIGLELISTYYPERVPPPPVPKARSKQADAFSQPVEVFNFRAEMRETRVRVDELLAEGQLARAEEYMEQRRQFFWENGYQIRKINQAYFAFYGSYND
ncbi:MAG: hypothetical protein WA110_04640, partial [Anaerolineaceae bacterium]